MALTNEFRFGYNWGAFSNLQENYNVDEATKLGLGGMPFGPGHPDNGGLPIVGVGGITGFGTHYYDPSVEGQNVYQILDNVTKILGSHSLKFGVDMQSIRISFLQPPNPRGSYGYGGLYTSNLGESFTGFGVADFLADQMTGASISNESPISDTEWYRSAYAQDDWRVTNRLTMNLGLRYDYYQPYKEQSGRQANFVRTAPFGEVGTGAAIYEIPAQSRNVPLPTAFTNILANENISIQYDNNSRLATGQMTAFAPRLGFAYQVDTKTVLRGGFGMFYGGLESVGANANIGENYPFSFQVGLSHANCAPNNCPSLGTQGATLETGLSKQLATGLANFIEFPNIYGTDTSIKTPVTTNYNFTAQHALSNNMAATLGYVGNFSRHLPTLVNPNAPDALLNPANNAQFVTPFPLIGGSTFLTYAGQSDYNSLQATLQKRYADGLNFLATYTWAHAMDDSVDPLGGGVGDRNTNLIPIIDEYTNSGYDVRNRFTFNGFYELPFGRGRAHMNHSNLADLIAGGWASNLTFFAQTGFPFTVFPNISTAAGGGARANLIGDPFASGGAPNPTNPNVTCPAHVHTRTNWYNPCAFANPLPGSIIPRTGVGSLVTGLPPQGYVPLPWRQVKPDIRARIRAYRCLYL
ncbi:MAG: TonB-dependent receptor domain-containing protein [Acidobacteriaceae bacterium]